MLAIIEEKKSQGSLFAFIDLLFLLVAFMVLVLFFVQLRKSEAEVQLEKVQEKLAVSDRKKSAIEETLAKLAPVIEQFTLKNKEEVERRRAKAAREMRRQQRTPVRVEYQIEKDGRIRYKGRVYSLEKFRGSVVSLLRKKNWISFRAFASPETPFGTVVEFRRALLKGSNEFDTYWDNLPSNP